MEKIYQYFKKLVGEERVFRNEPMKNHTYFKIGGPAQVLIEVRSVEEIEKIIKKANKAKVKYYIIGNGTNLLVEDQGIDAIIIKISEDFDRVKIEGELVYAQAGITLTNLSKKVARAALSGLEFASGIPGTLGGAIFMNAGAYGGEMRDVVKYVRVLTEAGEIKEIYNNHLEMGYRTSIVRDKNYIVLEVCLALKKGNKEEIFSKIKELDKKRTSKQPLSMPSAGSTFKRPDGHYASKLIDDAGLKGVRFGDAQVSPKHSGFVVNCGEATCRNVLDLVAFIKKVVKDKYDVMLEREVRILGRD